MHRLRQAAILSWWKERAWGEVVLLVTTASFSALFFLFQALYRLGYATALVMGGKTC